MWVPGEGAEALSGHQALNLSSWMPMEQPARRHVRGGPGFTFLEDPSMCSFRTWPSYPEPAVHVKHLLCVEPLWPCPSGGG